MKSNLLIVCCCLGWAATATGAPITLDACLQRTGQHSSTVKSFEMAARAADESLTISRTYFYPTLKLKASYTLADNPERLIISGNSFAPGVPAQDVNLSTGDRDSYSIGLYLQQTLYTGGNLTHSRRRAEYQVEAALNDTAYQRSKAAQMVKKTFSEALAARLQVQALLKSLDATREQARVVRERLQEGHARREDLLSVEMDVSRAEAAWAQAENQAEMILTTLRKLINAAPNESIEPTGSLFKTHLTAPLNDLLTLGLQKRSDLKSLQAKVRQGSADIAIARSAYFPQVSLVGSYQRQPETAIMRADVWKIGAQAEWSLFEWGRTSAEVRRAAALERQEMFRLDEERKNVQLEVEQFWRGVKDAESRLRAAEAHLKSLEYTQERILNRYQEGLVKRVDFLLAEAALWNAYATYIQNAADLNTTLASLEQASGTDLTPWLVHTPLYQPAFDGITEQIERAAPPELQLPESEKSAPVNVSGEKPVLPGQDAKPAYMVQLGAYKLHDNAEQALKLLARGLKSVPNLTIVNESDLFKVMAGPFSQKDEAFRAATDLGAKNFIVKVTHGP